MSTTVTYKGSTLTTVNNNTKTLKTAGKYMEGDVVLTDVSGGTSAISVVDTIDSHGGTIREITALDISDTTAVASDVAQGKYFYTSAGVKTAGTATGGGQTTEIIIPEQTVTTTSSSTEVQVVANKPIVSGEEYIITVDGVSVTATAESLYGGIWLYHIQGQVAIEQYNEAYFYTNSSYAGTHTVKVEKATGGSGDEYTRTIIVPQQTITASSASTSISVPNTTGIIEDAKHYIVTLDGVEWFTTCETLWTENYVLGDPNWYLTTPANYVYPFGIIYGSSEGITIAFAAAGQHTVKIERVDLVENGLMLISKSITSNGTYNASEDNVDGYSSIIANIARIQTGLVYETGTLTPESDINTPIISFANTHDDIPIYINIADTTETLATENSNLYWTFMNWYTLNDATINTTSSSNIYARYQYAWKTSSGASAGNIDCTTLSGSNSDSIYYLVEPSRFGPYCGGSRMWRAGRTYKWIAVWAPPDPTEIPLNIELIDYTKITPDYNLDSNGEVKEAQWYGVTDYTPIAPDMTFSFKGNMWAYTAVYDSSKNFISSFSPYSIGMSADPNNSDVAVGTLGGDGIAIPYNAAYIRISTMASPDNTVCSLIRTA